MIHAEVTRKHLRNLSPPEYRRSIIHADESNSRRIDYRCEDRRCERRAVITGCLGSLQSVVRCTRFEAALVGSRRLTALIGRRNAAIFRTEPKSKIVLLMGDILGAAWS